MREFKKGRSDDRRGNRSSRGSDRRDDSDEGDFKSFRAKRSGRFDRRDSGRSSRIEMHEVICDKCGEKCEVPFKPTSSKPVYCSDCFKKEDGRSKGRSSSGLDEVNKKLDKIMKALKIE